MSPTSYLTAPPRSSIIFTRRLNHNGNSAGLANVVESGAEFLDTACIETLDYAMGRERQAFCQL
jgi:hypothetical protein